MAAGIGSILGAIGGSGGGGGGGGFGGFVDSIFGKDSLKTMEANQATKKQGLTTDSSDKVVSGAQSEQLKLDQAAIEKLISDVLSGPGGLAEIFAGEQNAGIFNSSAAAQAAGDLSAKLVGELAKITGEKVTSRAEQSKGIDVQKSVEAGRSEAISSEADQSGGLLGKVIDFSKASGDALKRGDLLTASAADPSDILGEAEELGKANSEGNRVESSFDLSENLFAGAAPIEEEDEDEEDDKKQGEG